ncbi:MAG: hypothetical protein ACRELV_17505 [Longimicrobiales bacterium]
MTKRIVSFDVLQSAKTLGAMYVLIGLIAAPFLILAGVITGDGASIVMGLFAPILYGVFGFIFVTITLFFYNVIAGRLGGVQVVLADPPLAGTYE